MVVGGPISDCPTSASTRATDFLACNPRLRSSRASIDLPASVAPRRRTVPPRSTTRSSTRLVPSGQVAWVHTHRHHDDGGSMCEAAPAGCVFARRARRTASDAMEPHRFRSRGTRLRLPAKARSQTEYRCGGEGEETRGPLRGTLWPAAGCRRGEDAMEQEGLSSSGRAPAGRGGARYRRRVRVPPSAAMSSSGSVSTSAPHRCPWCPPRLPVVMGLMPVALRSRSTATGVLLVVWSGEGVASSRPAFPLRSSRRAGLPCASAGTRPRGSSTCSARPTSS